MGITVDSMALLARYLPRCRRMFELGAQQLVHEGWKPAKPFFHRAGIEHVSLDVNGAYGSIPWSITDDISKFGEFDVVTNFGTSEHILDQPTTFRHLHLLCRTAGFMVHVVPWVRSWPGHAPYAYTFDFFERLAVTQEYRIDQLMLQDSFDDDSRRNIVCVFQKMKERFRPCDELFASLPCDAQNPRQGDYWFKSQTVG